MRIFAKIRQVYDRLCERSADRMRQEPEHLSEQAKMERQLAVERDSKRWSSSKMKSARDARLDLLAKP